MYSPPLLRLLNSNLLLAGFDICVVSRTQSFHPYHIITQLKGFATFYKIISTIKILQLMVHSPLICTNSVIIYLI